MHPDTPGRPDTTTGRRQRWVAYVAPPLPPTPVRGLLLLAPLAGQPQQGSQARAGHRSRTRVAGGGEETVLLVGFGRTGVTFGTPGHFRYTRTRVKRALRHD
jgi:hypothetical protein